MKRIAIVPVLAAVMFAAACGESTPVAVDLRPQVRFFNVTKGMAGSGGFTRNGQFATGSALAFGQSSCVKVDAGPTSFGFGAANTDGTGLSGSALATLNDQSIMEGGNFIVVAAGDAASPTLFLLDNSLPGSLGANLAAVRFVNFAPGTGTTPSGPTPYAYFVYLGAIGSTAVATNLALGAPSTFAALTSGANTFSVLQIPGHTVAVESSTATLPAGSVNTMAIVPNTSGGYQLINLPRCS